MRESALQARCKRWCSDHGMLAINIHGSGWANKGLPDLLVLHGGKCVAVELKSGSGYAVQPDQLVWRRRFLRQGIAHRVASSPEEFERAMREEFGHAAG